MGKNQKMLEEASFSKLLLNLCLPTILIMLVMVIYNMADTFFIGQTGDPVKIAAISLCAPLFSVLSGLGTLFGSGGAPRFPGHWKKETARIKSYTSLCCCGSLLSVFFSPHCPSCRKADFPGPWRGRGYAFPYLQLPAHHCAGRPGNSVQQRLCQYHTGRRRGKGVHDCNHSGNAVQYRPGCPVHPGLFLGRGRRRLATVFGNLISCCYLLYYILKKQPAFSLHPKFLSLKKEILLPVTTLGLPLACSTLLMSISSMISNRLMMGYGPVALGGPGCGRKNRNAAFHAGHGYLYGYAACHFLQLRPGQQGTDEPHYPKHRHFYGDSWYPSHPHLFFCPRPDYYGLYRQCPSDFLWSDHGAGIHYYRPLLWGCTSFARPSCSPPGKPPMPHWWRSLTKDCFICRAVLLNHRFGFYGIAFTGAATLAFSLAAGIFFSLRWNGAACDVTAAIPNSSVFR